MLEAGCLSEASLAIYQQTRPRILEDLDPQMSGFEILVAVFIFMCPAMLYRRLLGNNSWSFNIGPTRVSETSVRNYHYTLRSITEESISQLTTWRRRVEHPFSTHLGNFMLKMEAYSSFERLVTIPLVKELIAPEESIISTSISVRIRQNMFMVPSLKCTTSDEIHAYVWLCYV
jgi:hypothetical protein